jgi:hypothetical protein
MAYWYANKVDGHEEKIDAAAKTCQPDRPNLCNKDATDGAARRSKVQATGSNKSRKNLECKVSVYCLFREWEHVHHTSEL